jgi:hypothetical protein
MCWSIATITDFKKNIKTIIKKGPKGVWAALKKKNKNRCKRRWTLRGINISDKEFRSFFNNEERDKSDFIIILKEKIQSRFIIDSSKRGEYIDIFKEINPGGYDKAATEADNICRHIFSLLGSGPVDLGKKINWHLDFKSGYEWEAHYFKDFTYKNFKMNVDIKVPLELSRFQHLTTLGKAYWLTENEKYSKEFISQINEWTANNPVGIGVNWFCPMDAALRAVNWIWGYYFFKDSECLMEEFLAKFYKNLYLHGRHIMGNIEYGAKGKTNHYIADLVGLLYVGLFFQDSQEAKKWYDFAREELLEELRDQVYEDGMNHEASTAYHRFVVELFCSAAVLCRAIGDNWPREAWEKIHKMFRFAKGIIKPDGTIPQLGDNDSGRIHKLQYLENELGLTYLFPLAATLFDDSSFKMKGIEFSEEALWLLGPEAFEKYKNMEEGTSLERLPSISFLDGGIYVLRDNINYCMVSAGPNGQKGNGGHSHNDKLSFELNIDGMDIIVDPGTFIYTGDYKKRNLFRSTKYHNTVVLDDNEINPFDELKLFQLLEKNRCMVERFAEDENQIVFCGSHHAYGTTYTREITYYKKERTWVIEDRFSETDTTAHNITLYLHFAPGIYLRPVEIDNGKWQEPGKKGLIHADIEEIPCREFFSFGTGKKSFRLHICSSLDIEAEISPSWVSPGYGVKEKAQQLEIRVVSSLPVRFISIIYPLQM